MGLTILYELKATAKTANRAGRLVEQMRQLALDLPFDDVGDVVSLEGDDCNFEKQRGKVDDSRFWLLIQAAQHVTVPWNNRMSVGIMPKRIIAFDTYPGPGSEAANFGLCQYPATIEVEYRPKNDARFNREYQPFGPGSKGWRFSWEHWERWLKRNRHDRYLLPDDDQFIKSRNVRTGLAGWRWSSFCKTQYASDPRCGGIPNFLRCHVGVVTLLDRIAALPGMTVEVDDEGKYAASRYSDDWQEAEAEGQEPTYVRHPGKYDARALASEVGDWNQMIAAFSGALADAFERSGIESESAIAGFPNFGQLEFEGSKDARIEPFLTAMKRLAEQNTTSDDE